MTCLRFAKRLCVSFVYLNSFFVNLLCGFLCICGVCFLSDSRMVCVSFFCIAHYPFNELVACCSTFVLRVCVVCDLCTVCVSRLHNVHYFCYEFVVCLCIFWGVFSLLCCEPVVCVSAFLVCVLCVCFVHGLCVVFACFPMRFFFMNLLRAFLHLSCVFCVSVA